MRYNARFIMLFMLIGTLGISLLACGKEEAQKAEPKLAEAAQASADKAQVDEAKPESTYAPPEALSLKERKKEYPKGKRKAATKKNTDALKLRKKDDSAGAIAAYQEAIKLSPNYVNGRFNLACEYARFAKADEAIAELEHLYKIGSPKAMRKLGKIQVDKDFDPIREDPRIKAIVAGFAVDFDQMLFKQVCANEGKMITLMDHEEGLYAISTRINQNKGVMTGKAKLIKGGKARGHVFKILDTVCDSGKILRDERAEGPILSDTKLSKWTEKYVKRCVKYYGNVEGDSEVDGDIHGTNIEGAFCFIRQGEAWTLGVAGQWSADEQMESDVESVVDTSVKKAVKAWGS